MMYLTRAEEQALLRLATGQVYGPDDRARLHGMFERLAVRQQLREAMDRVNQPNPEPRA